MNHFIVFMLPSMYLVLSLNYLFNQATNPALCLHRCIKARNINCLRDKDRTCLRNTSRSITPLRNASPI